MRSLLAQYLLQRPLLIEPLRISNHFALFAASHHQAFARQNAHVAVEHLRAEHLQFLVQLHLRVVRGYEFLFLLLQVVAEGVVVAVVLDAVAF